MLFAFQILSNQNLKCDFILFKQLRQKLEREVFNCDKPQKVNE